MEVIDSYEKILDIRIIKQSDGLIDEAMNLIFSNSSSDILLTTDDEIPSFNWIEDHLKFHERFENVGVVRGKVIKKSQAVKRRSYKQLIKRIIYRPYSDIFKDYYGYLTVFGIPTDREAVIPKGGFIKTIALAYENLSVKYNVYKDFRVPCYSLRGFHSEDMLALHAIKKGFLQLK